MGVYRPARKGFLRHGKQEQVSVRGFFLFRENRHRDRSVHRRFY